MYSEVLYNMWTLKWNGKCEILLDMMSIYKLNLYIVHIYIQDTTVLLLYNIQHTLPSEIYLILILITMNYVWLRLSIHLYMNSTMSWGGLI